GYLRDRQFRRLDRHAVIDLGYPHNSFLLRLLLRAEGSGAGLSFTRERIRWQFDLETVGLRAVLVGSFLDVPACHVPYLHVMEGLTPCQPHESRLPMPLSPLDRDAVHPPSPLTAVPCPPHPASRYAAR